MSKRKILAIPFAALAGVLVMTSMSYACTVWMGKFKVKGSAGTGEVVAVGDPTTGMKHKSVSSAYAINENNPGGELRLRVEPEASGSSNKLPRFNSDGTVKKYYLRFDPFTSSSDGDFPTHTAWKYDCMAGSFGYTMGDYVTVDSNGYSYGGSVGGYWYRKIQSTSATTPWDGTKYYNEAATCISDAGAGYGNQAPVTLV
ncbi:MAG: hypothetical protein M3Q48_10260 [Actinomycetota bacterium]|nr:hypothetical protein [Actinomycetota bacterium]